MPYTPWPAPHVDILRTDAAAGCSAQSIGDKLGLSPEAVIAKAHRIKVKLHYRGNQFWSEEEVEQIRSLLAEGMSAGQAAKAFGNGVTKNGIIGIAGRRGIKFLHGPGARSENARPKRLHQPKRTWLKKLSAPHPKPEAVVEEKPVNEPLPLHIPLLELQGHHCRWPFGTKNYTFCGHPKHAGSSYCPHHDKRSQPQHQNAFGSIRQDRVRATREYIGIKPADIDP